MSHDPLRGPRIAVIGASGAVGRLSLRLLDGGRELPGLVTPPRLFASSRSAGSTISTATWGDLVVEDVAALPPADWSEVDVAVVSIGATASRSLLPAIAGEGVIVVDNSSAFRRVDGVPLVAAGVNDHAVEQAFAEPHRGIIANPNCTTLGLIMAAAPLHRAFGLTRVVVTSAQAASGKGQAGVDELNDQLRVVGAASDDALVYGNDLDQPHEEFPGPLACNVVPLAGDVVDADASTPDEAFVAGYTDEEWKLVREPRKILDLPDLDVQPTCTRVGVKTGHSVDATLSFREPFALDEAREVLRSASGVELWEGARPPTARDAVGRDEVLIGRVRALIPHPRDGDAGERVTSLRLWAACDNLRKGAALNAVQIAAIVATRLRA